MPCRAQPPPRRLSLLPLHEAPALPRSRPAAPSPPLPNIYTTPALSPTLSFLLSVLLVPLYGDSLVRSLSLSRSLRRLLQNTRYPNSFAFINCNFDADRMDMSIIEGRGRERERWEVWSVLIIGAVFHSLRLVAGICCYRETIFSDYSSVTRVLRGAIVL